MMLDENCIYQLIVDGQLCKPGWRLVLDHSIPDKYRVEYSDGSAVDIFFPIFDRDHKVVIAQSVQSAIVPTEEAVADILEFIHKNKTFTASEVIEEKITNVLVRLSDYNATRSASEIDRNIIESIRRDVLSIRNAVRAILEEEEGE